MALLCAAGLFVLAAVVMPMCLSFMEAGIGLGAGAGGAAYMDAAVVERMRKEIEEEWFSRLQEERSRIIADGASRVVIRYNAETEGDGDSRIRLVNWNDVLAVWLLRSRRTIGETDRDDVRDIYFGMNPWSVSYSPAEAGTAYIDVRNLRCEDTPGLYGYTEEQVAEMRGWINPSEGGSSLWIMLLGSSVRAGEEFAAAYLDVGLGSAVQIILQEAQKRAGWIYSQPLRARPGYADCSSLVWSCYRAVGITFGASWPTAAAIAQWCDENGCRVPASERSPGDIIIWGGKSNGRYLGVYHVAIYAGDGMMWEAAPSAGGVVYREVAKQVPSRILFYARPCAAAGFSWSAGDLPAGLENARSVRLQTTAYCEACDTIYGEGRTASGTYPQRGTIATSRTRQFPFGTRLYIPGYGFGTVEDTGGFPDGTIDLYLGHRTKCTCGDDWGRKVLTVYILDQASG